MYRAIFIVPFIFFYLTSYSQQLIPRKVIFSEQVNSSVQLSPDGEYCGWTQTENGKRKICTQKTDLPETNGKIELEGELISWQWTQQVKKTQSREYYLAKILVQEKIANQYELKICYHHNAKSVVSVLSSAQAMRVFPLSPHVSEGAMVLVNSGDTAKAGIYLVTLNGSFQRKMFSLNGFTNFYFDGKYNLKAATKPNDQQGHDLFVFDNKGTAKLLRSYGMDLSEQLGVPLNAVSGIKYDGSEMYFTDNYSTDKAVLYSYSFESGKIVKLAESKTADLIPSSATFDPETNAITSIAYIYDLTRRIFFDKEWQKHFMELEKMKMGEPAIISRAVNKWNWLVRFNSGGPNRYYYFAPVGKSLLTGPEEYPAIGKKEFSIRSGIVVAAKDKTELPCQLFLPPGSDNNNDGIPDKPLPAILYVHGGPWLGFYQNNWLINRHLQLLANRGYAVVNCSFRGSMGFGKKFFEKSFGEWGGAMHQDLLDIAAYLADKKIAVKEKTGIFGWSYGGYATSLALGKSPGVFACGINLYGVNNLETFMPLRPDWNIWVADANTTTGSEKIKNHSPHTYVSQIKSPMLISHGGQDDNVPPAQSDEYVELLIKQNKKVIYTFYPDEPHDYRLPKSWNGFWDYAEIFLEQHLGGAVEPVGDDLRDPNFEWKAGKELLGL